MPSPRPLPRPRRPRSLPPSLPARAGETAAETGLRPGRAGGRPRVKALGLAGRAGMRDLGRRCLSALHGDSRGHLTLACPPVGLVSVYDVSKRVRN